MKSKKILALAASLFILSSGFLSAKSVSTYTFVNPCQPFGLSSPVPNTYGCFSFTATNAGTSDPAGYYSWSFGDGTSATGTNVLHCYSPSSVSVVYTITLGYNSVAFCGALPVVQNFTLMVNPPAQGLCVHNTPSVSLAAKSVTVWAGSMIPEISTTYNFGDGKPVSIANIHSYAICGNYIIKIKEEDMNQPQNPCCSYAAVNMSCAAVVTGIPDRQTDPDNLRLFPVPASENLNIVSDKSINGIKIVDLLGKEFLFKASVNATEIQVKISKFPAGTYLVKVSYSDGAEKIMKFFKE